ncbi:MAG: pilus assembly protein PilM [Chloroflexi bacterium]|nr:pilus assembly protein PilM [Chloroflexota bacterium]
MRVDFSRMRRELRELLARNTVTISAEGGSLKLLVTKGRRVVRWETIPLSADILRDGVVLDPTRLGSVIKERLDSHRLFSSNVVTSVTGLHSLTRLVTLPKTPRRLLREAVVRESQRAMPVSLDNLDLSWQILDTKNGTLPIYLLAVPQNILDGQIQALRQGGMYPYIIDLKPLALARAVNSRNAFVLDIQPNDFDIILVADGVPVITRTVLFPQGRGSFDVEQERAVIIIEEFLRTRKFFDNRHRDRSPYPDDTPLFLTGETNQLTGIRAMLTREVPYPITPLEPPLKYPPSFPVTEYATNVGLALKELPQPRNARNQGSAPGLELNILPDRHRRRVKVNKSLLWIAGVLAGVALMLPMYQSTVDASEETTRLRSQLSGSEQRVTLRALDTKRRHEFEQSVEQASALVGQLEQGYKTFFDKKLSYSDPLSALSQSLPPSVRLNTIGNSGGQIGLDGDADSYADVVNYSQLLTEYEGFPDASISFVQGGGGGGRGDEISKASFRIALGKYQPEMVKQNPQGP